MLGVEAAGWRCRPPVQLLVWVELEEAAMPEVQVLLAQTAL
jgi:hypothetical protein